MKSDTEKVLAVLVKKGVYQSAQAALLRDRRWLTWGVPAAYRWWFGLEKTVQGHRMRYCFTDHCLLPGHYLIWNERVVRERGPNKRVVRTKFDTCPTSLAAHDKAGQRKNRQ